MRTRRMALSNYIVTAVLATSLSVAGLAAAREAPMGGAGAPEADGAYKIGPEDVLDIAVWDNSAINRTVPVRPDGKISLPLLNEVQAAGLTPMQLRDVLTKELAEYAPNPEVSVAPYELLKFLRLEVLLDEAGRGYDAVVLDTPPFIPGPDCRVIAKDVDGFLTVVAAHRTPRGELARTLDLMDPAKAAGRVFNGDNTRHSNYSTAYVGSPHGARWRFPWRTP